MTDRIIQGVVFMFMLMAAWLAWRVIKAAFSWLRHDAARSLGRATGLVAGVSRDLAEGFKDGLNKK